RDAGDSRGMPPDRQPEAGRRQPACHARALRHVRRRHQLCPHPPPVLRRAGSEGRRGREWRALLFVPDLPPPAGGLFRHGRGEVAGAPGRLLCAPARVGPAGPDPCSKGDAAAQSQGTMSRQLLLPPFLRASASRLRSFLASSSPMSSVGAVGAGARYSSGGSDRNRRTSGLPWRATARRRLNSSRRLAALTGTVWLRMTSGLIGSSSATSGLSLRTVGRKDGS